MLPRRRRTLLTLLTGVFFVQSWLVYTDPAGRERPRLSPAAQAGQDLWFAHNCQSCHQVYGFGGFLGPDLTNVAGRLAPGAEDPVAALAARLEAALTTGSAVMPAFDFSPDERASLAAFFVELDRTGTGQARQREAGTPRDLFAALVGRLGSEDDPLTAAEARGRAVALERGCIDCHLPNANSLFRATDLTRVHATVYPARVADALTNGVPTKGMPSFGLDASDVAAVGAFLERLGRSGEDVRAAFADAERSADGSLRGLPWFEYPER